MMLSAAARRALPHRARLVAGRLPQGGRGGGLVASSSSAGARAPAAQPAPKEGGGGGAGSGGGGGGGGGLGGVIVVLSIAATSFAAYGKSPWFREKVDGYGPPPEFVFDLYDKIPGWDVPRPKKDPKAGGSYGKTTAQSDREPTAPTATTGKVQELKVNLKREATQIRNAPPAASVPAPTSGSSVKHPDANEAAASSSPSPEVSKSSAPEKPEKEVSRPPKAASGEVERKTKESRENLHREVDRATSELQAHEAALRRELEIGLLRDLDNLDAGALRYRIAQLAAEMLERTKIDALRLHETMRHAEAEAERRYASLLQREREHAEVDKERALAAQEKEIRMAASQEYTSQLNELLGQQAREFEHLFKQKLEEQEASYRQEVEKEVQAAAAAVRAKAMQESMQRRQELKELANRVLSLQRIVDSRDEAERASIGVHTVTAATLALGDVLRTSSPAANELRVLEAVAGSDELIGAALSTLPESASSDGIPTLPQLATRFQNVHREGRRAALVPENSPGIVGQALATALSFLVVPRHGLVEGGSAEDVLTRAEYYVKGGDLHSAVKELETLHGLPAKAVSDWVRDAKGRLQADQVADIMRVHASLLNASFCK